MILKITNYFAVGAVMKERSLDCPGTFTAMAGFKGCYQRHIIWLLSK